MAENIPVDWELAVSLANGNEETAKQLLQLLLQQLPENKADSQRYYTNNDYRSLRDLVHKIHGATCYCGVPQLKIATRDLENALRNQQMDSIETLFSQFINAINAVQTAAVEIVDDGLNS